MRLDAFIRPKYQSQINSFIKKNAPKQETNSTNNGGFKSLFK
jgi:hypothetical protein